MKKYILEIIVFICGAVVMILELVGSRVLSPYLGTSIVVWTSLIGIILGSLSLGYWWGGTIADKRPNYRAFSSIIFGSAMLIGFITLAKTVVLEFLQTSVGSVHVAASLATLILFAPPSTLLGMVSPYAVKLKMKDIEHSGTTVGSLYAISTVGSIAGTFLAGFFLIAYFGSTRILLFLSIVLTATSLLAYFRSFPALKIGMLSSLILSLLLADSYAAFQKKQGFIDVDTQYNRVWIYKSVDSATDRPIRVMVTNPEETQSAMFLDDDDDLVLRYTRFYRLAGHFKPELKMSLMIGGAGYSYPKDYLRRFPDARMDVVEIDPQLTKLARQYFNLKDNARLKIHHEDGRTFLNTTKTKYDVIFGDAFNSFYSIPYQLTTQEAVLRMHGLLNEGGVVIENIISSIEGEKGRFLRAEYATFASVFPQVYLFPVRDAEDGSGVQNVMLIALKSEREAALKNDDQELSAYLQHLWTGKISTDVPLLTDDFAPVDNYILKIVENF